MKRRHIIGFIIAFLWMALAGRAQQLTPIADKLLAGNGAPAKGNLTLTLNTTIVTFDGFNIFTNTQTVVALAADGSFSVSLAPNIGASPYGSIYYADYQTANAYVREIWAVPISTSAVNLKAVRVIWPQSPSVMIPASQFLPPASCTTQAAMLNNLVLRYTINPAGWICAPDNVGAVELNLENPTPADAGKFQWEPKNGLKITRVYCDVDVGNTVTINLDIRPEGSTNTPALSQVLSTPLVCTPTGASTTSFTNPSVPGLNSVTLLPLSVTGSPGIVRVHIEYLLN